MAENASLEDKSLQELEESKLKFEARLLAPVKYKFGDCIARFADTKIKVYYDEVVKEVKREEVKLVRKSRQEGRYIIVILRETVDENGQPDEEQVFPPIYSTRPHWETTGKESKLAEKILLHNLVEDGDEKERRREAKLLAEKIISSLSNQWAKFNKTMSQYQELLSRIEKKKLELDSTKSFVDRYGEENYKKAQELLHNPLLIQVINAYLGFYIAGEYRKRLFTFIGALTKDIGGWGIPALGKQAEGKSTIQETILNLFPDQMLARLNTATEAYLYRLSQTDPRYFDCKIVYFGDLGDLSDLSREQDEEKRKVFEVFKQLLTEGIVRKGLVLSLEDDEGKLEALPAELVLEGRPTIMFSSISAKLEGQFESRCIPWSPTTSPKQNLVVKRYQQISKSTPKSIWLPKEVEELKRVIKCALDILSKVEGEIVNPFTYAIDEAIVRDSVNIKRDRPKIYALIDSITHLYCHQRHKIEVNGKTYFLTSPIDVLYALYIAEDEICQMLASISGSTLKAYETISKNAKPLSRPLNELLDCSRTKGLDGFDKEAKEAFESAKKELQEKAFTSTDLEKWTGESRNTCQMHLRVLARANLIFKVERGGGLEHLHYLPHSQDLSGVKTNGTSVFQRATLVQSLKDKKKLEESLEWLRNLERTGSVSNNIFEKNLKEVDQLSFDNLKTPSYYPEKIIAYTPPWESFARGQLEPPESFSYLKETGTDVARQFTPVSNESNNSLPNGASQHEMVKEILNCIERFGTPVLAGAVVNRLHSERGYDKARIHQAILKLLRDGSLFIANRDEMGNEYIWLAK